MGDDWRAGGLFWVKAIRDEGTKGLRRRVEYAFRVWDWGCGNLYRSIREG